MSELIETEIGFLPKNWSVVTLDEIADVIDPHPSHRAPKAVDNGFPFAGIGDVDEYGNIRIEKARQISEEFVLQQENSYEINEYSIGYGRVGTVGKVVKLRKQEYRYALSPTLAVINPKNNVNPRFVYCLVRTKNFYHQVLQQMTGTTRPAIGIQLLRKIKVPLPSPEEQDKIVNLICSLDDKIEINSNTNQILEQITQAIFKSWFVDFEPVKAKVIAKQNGQNPDLSAMCAISGKTKEQLKGFDEVALQLLITTAALFPDALVESELGEIPEGWQVKNIEELSTNVAMGPFGSNIKVETFVKEGIPIINGQQLKGTMLEDWENKFLTYEHADKLIKSNVYRGDIVITHRGTLGQVSIIPEGSKYERYIVSQSQCYIRPDREVVSPLFMVFYFKSYLGQHELLAHKSQVGVPAIAKPVTNLRKIELVAPTKGVSDKFQEAVSNMQRVISKNLYETGSLQELRNSLLPKLLSGEVKLDVRRVEAEEVT